MFAPLHLSRILDRQLSFHEDTYYFLVDRVDHIPEQFKRFKLIDKQGILLLIGRVLHRLLKIVEFTQIFLPVLIDRGKCHRLFIRTDEFLTIRLIILLKVRDNIIGLEAIRDRYQDTLIGFCLMFVYISDYGERFLSYAFRFSCISLPGGQAIAIVDSDGSVLE